MCVIYWPMMLAKARRVCESPAPLRTERQAYPRLRIVKPIPPAPKSATKGLARAALAYIGTLLNALLPKDGLAPGIKKYVNALLNPSLPRDSFPRHTGANPSFFDSPDENAVGSPAWVANLREHSAVGPPPGAAPKRHELPFPP